MISCFETKPLAKTYYVNGLVVDAGFPVKEKVDVLVITHCHIDHIIYANEIKKKHKCKIAIGRRDAKHVKKHDIHTLQSLFGKDLRPIIPDIILKDGDTLKAGNLIFKVIETPGHTQGSICLYEPKKQILFSGDTWFGKGIYGRTDLPGGSEKELKKSIQKLKKLKIKKMYPGH